MNLKETTGKRASSARAGNMLIERTIHVAFGAILLGGVAIAQAPPASLFQLNGNATNTNSSCSYGPCDYFNLINGTGGTNGAPGNNSQSGHSLIRTFIDGTKT